MLPTNFGGLRVDVTFTNALGETASMRYSVQSVSEDGTVRVRPCRRNGVSVDLRKSGITLDTRWKHLRIEDSGHRFS